MSDPNFVFKMFETFFRKHNIYMAKFDIYFDSSVYEIEIECLNFNISCETFFDFLDSNQCTLIKHSVDINLGGAQRDVFSIILDQQHVGAAYYLGIETPEILFNYD